MAKRKLYPVERKVLETGIGSLKKRQEWLTECFIRDYNMVGEEIARLKTMLDAGEIEEGVFSES